MNSYRSFFLRHGHRLRTADLYAPVPGKRLNPGWDASPFRVLIVRLSPWRDVEQSTPHHFLEGAVRRALPDAFVDFAFFPPAHDLQILKESGIPLLTGIADFREARNFDLLLVSVSYVLELPNLPLLLTGSGLNRYSGERGENDPIVILGGSSVSASQSVIAESGDMYPDALYFGEGEGEVERLVSRLYDVRTRSRADRLKVFDDFPCTLPAGRTSGPSSGIPVTAHRHESRSAVDGSEKPRNADAPSRRGTGETTGGGSHAPGRTGPGAPDDEAFTSTMLNGGEAGTVRLQIARGCPAFCTFCFESYDRKPYRELPADIVLDRALRLKRAVGADTLELYSFNFNTHASILPLLLELNAIFHRVNYMSQRLDYLGSVSGLMEAEIRSGKRSFTLGIEGISARIRTLYQKNLENRDLDGVLARLHDLKARELKLFFVLSGYETGNDFEEFRRFLKQLKTLRQNSPSAPRIVFSFNLLTRMPGTPFQFDKLFLDGDEWRSIVSETKCAVETHGFEYRLATRFDEYALAQVLALGGNFTHEILETLHDRGLFFDQFLPEEAWAAAREVLASRGVLEGDFLREKDGSWIFPFDRVKTGVSKEFLYRAWLRSKQEKPLPTCLGSRCIGCDACADEEEKTALANHSVGIPAEGVSSYLSRLGSIMGEKAKMKPVMILLDTPYELAHASPAYRNAWAAREIFREMPETPDIVYSLQESYFSRKENLYRYPGWYGTGLFSVYTGDPDRLRILFDENSGGVLNIRRVPVGHTGSQGDGGTELSYLRGELHFDGEITPGADALFERFLVANHLPFNIRKTGDGVRTLEFSEKAKKKRMILDARMEKKGMDTIIVIGCTSKFSPAEMFSGDRSLVRTMTLDVKELGFR